ncbi:hypothetical protein Hdeb2414_s0010g00342121 [Helianthus debilis subsp. tardiflorus]
MNKVKQAPKSPFTPNFPPINHTLSPLSPMLARMPHLRRATTVPPPSPFALLQLKCTKSNHFFQVTKEAFHSPTISKHFQSCTYCITTCTVSIFSSLICSNPFRVSSKFQHPYKYNLGLNKDLLLGLAVGIKDFAVRLEDYYCRA